jgi:two-component system, cell cycle sensor histidine kinase and response regulator CckA
MGALFLGLAGLLAVLLAWVIVAVGSTPRGLLYSDTLEICVLLLAALSSLAAGVRSSGEARRIWMLAGAGLGFLTAAQALVTYYSHVLRAKQLSPWPADVLFWVWVAPLIMTLLPPPRGEATTGAWLRALDFLQIVVASLTVYLYFFYIPSVWEAKGLEVFRYILRVDLVRDSLIAGALILRASRTRTLWARRLYGRLGLFMSLTAGTDLVLLSIPGLGMGVVTWGTFAWCVPAFALIGLAATWKDTLSEEKEEQRASNAGVLIVSQVLPLLIPALVLLMARQIAKEQLTIAWAAIAMSFACSGARLILTSAELRRTADELRGSLRLLASVSEGTTDAIFVKDLQCRYLMINAAGARLLGRTAKDVVGKLDTELFSPETGRQMMETDRAIMRSGQVQVQEEIGTAAGVTRTYFSTKGPYHDHNGKVIGLIGISRDITERQKFEKHLRQAQKLEAIGNLAGGIAHDFNNLLTVIRGYCSMLQERPQKDESIVRPIQQIDDAASRAASLTSQLLAFSRRQVLQPRVLNLNDIVQDMQTLLNRLIGENISLLAALDPNLSSVKADQSQMEQVIMNLVVNARDAMPEGGKLTIETANVVDGENTAKEHGVAALGPAVLLAISDNGHGMDRETLAHIFEPFFTTKELGKGTGLGLSTVYGIIKQSGGYIWAYSEPERGTSFKIYLPRVMERAVPLKFAPPATRTEGTETILLVEDDDTLRELACMILRESGYSVLTAKTPEVALQISSSDGDSIHLLLTDVIMHGMNGRQLAQRISSRRPGIRVLFMSGYTANAIVHQGVLDSGTDYLPKPFTADALRARVRQVLDAESPPARS